DLFIYNFANAKNGRYRTENIRHVGEPPHLLDSALVDFSTQQISRFLTAKGYFNAKVTHQIDVKQKKARVVFRVVPGSPFTLRGVQLDIHDPALEQLYANERKQTTRIRPGTRYDADSLVAEREHIYQLMRRHGYYEYLRQYMRVDVDSNLHSNQADIKLYIDNPEGQPAHTKFTIDSSFITIRHDRSALNETVPDHETLPAGLHFEDHTTRFRSAPVARYLFQQRGDAYDMGMENLTYDRLYELNSFRSVKIEYRKSDSNR